MATLELDARRPHAPDLAALSETEADAEWDAVKRLLPVGAVVPATVRAVRGPLTFLDLGSAFDGFLDPLERPADLTLSAGDPLWVRVIQHRDSDDPADRQVRVTVRDLDAT